MTQYLISFGANAMDHVPDEDAPGVARAARAAVQEAINAGVYVSAGGLEDQPASIVATDGAGTDGPYPQAIGGVTPPPPPPPPEGPRGGAPIPPPPPPAPQRPGRAGRPPNCARVPRRPVSR